MLVQCVESVRSLRRETANDLSGAGRRHRFHVEARGMGDVLAQGLYGGLNAHLIAA